MASCESEALIAPRTQVSHTSSTHSTPTKCSDSCCCNCVALTTSSVISSTHGTYCNLKDGDRLPSGYKIVAKIGHKGRVSIVYLAKKNGRDYAIKVFRADEENAFDDEMRVFNIIDAAPTSGMEKGAYESCPYLVERIETFAINYTTQQKADPRAELYTTLHPCIVMPAYGQTLSELLKFVNSALPIDTVKLITRQLLEGLEFLHRLGLIHSDIKPLNIMLSKPIQLISSNDEICVKIGDLNSAVLTEESTEDLKVGTAEYKAPEVILGMPFDTSIDIWSLGCVVYEMLTDCLLFDFGEESDNEESGEDLSSSNDETSSSSSSDDDDDDDSEPESSSSSSGSSSGSAESLEFHDMNYQHLYMIEKLIGRAPRDFRAAGRLYYNSHGRLKHNPQVDKADIGTILHDECEYTQEETADILEFLFRMIKYTDRDPAYALLAHPWLSKK